MKIQHSNNTALRALEILKLLFEGERTTEELLNTLQENDKADTVFRPDSLYKYFNTFRLFGLSPIKNGTKYSIQALPFLPPYTQEQQEGLAIFLEFAKKIFLSEDFQKVKNIICRLSNCAPNYSFESLEKLAPSVRTTYLELFEKDYNKDEFYKYKAICKTHQRIKFTFHNKALHKSQTVIADPKDIILKPSGCYLKAYNIANAETQDFSTADITNLEQLPQRSNTTNVNRAVTFKVKGRLAKSYELKIGERALDISADYMVVINEEEDPSILLRRLLRYGTQCEILYPSSMRDEALNLLRKIKENYS